MKLNEIESEIEKDSVIDKDDLEGESLKISILHTKYYKMFLKEAAILREYDYQYKKVKKERTSYYLGRGTTEEYETEPLDLKVNKIDIPLYIEADKYVHAAESKLEFQRNKTKLIEEFIKSINNRSFNISNAIKWRMFQNGQ